jgi:uncharacterized protein (TIGR03435 family)
MIFLLNDHGWQSPAFGLAARLRTVVLKRNAGRRLFLAGLSVAAVALPIAFGILNTPRCQAQSTAARPQFEVVSIKKRAEESTDFKCCFAPGGRLNVVNNRILNLIAVAWTMKHYQLKGGPTWLDSDHFDIEGRADGDPSMDEMKRMLQSLLVDRFKLKVHREMRTMPVYALTPARGGPKIQRFQEGDCTRFDPANPPAPPAPTEKPRCGFNILARGKWNASGITMQQVASGLADITSLPVIDKTGLTGLFNVHMDYVEDALAPDTPGPSIFTAVQQELGLKLESTREPAEVLVIDHIEKPSENW